MKGKTAGIFFPKIFVKGFADFSAAADGLSDVSLHEMGISPDAFAKIPPAQRKKLIAADAAKNPDRHRREVYRWYLACRNEEGVWTHYAAPFPPRGGLPKVVQWQSTPIGRRGSSSSTTCTCTKTRAGRRPSRRRRRGRRSTRHRPLNPPNSRQTVTQSGVLMVSTTPTSSCSSGEL